MTRVVGDDRARLLSHIVEADENGCWIWQASKRPNGYGQVRVAGRNMLAHRWAYELLVGPIPDGLVLDHLCRVIACVNPAHLEPVTQRENTLRGEGLPAQRARKTHCVHGHEFTDANTYRDPNRNGRRTCRICAREHDRRRGSGWSRQRKAAAAA